MKLSKVQQSVIDRLKDGWLLYSSVGPDNHVWMSKAGVFQNISLATLDALYSRKLIRYERKFPISRWYLTEQPQSRPAV